MFAVDDPTFLCERCFKNTQYVNEEDTAQNDEMNSEENREIRFKKACDFKAYHFSQI